MVLNTISPDTECNVFMLNVGSWGWTYLIIYFFCKRMNGVLSQWLAHPVGIALEIIMEQAVVNLGTLKKFLNMRLWFPENMSFEGSASLWHCLWKWKEFIRFLCAWSLSGLQWFLFYKVTYFYPCCTEKCSFLPSKRWQKTIFQPCLLHLSTCGY